MKKTIGTIFILILLITTGCTLVNTKRSIAIKCNDLSSNECSKVPDCDQIIKRPQTAPGSLGILGYNEYCVPKGDDETCASFATQKSCLDNQQCDYATIRSSGVCYLKD